MCERHSDETLVEALMSEKARRGVRPSDDRRTSGTIAFTSTNLNGCADTESVEEDDSRQVVRVELLGQDGPTGTPT
jgi:hypothetical protein